jgi:hypothetical protein
MPALLAQVRVMTVSLLRKTFHRRARRRARRENQQAASSRGLFFAFASFFRSFDVKTKSRRRAQKTLNNRSSEVKTFLKAVNPARG